MARTELILDTVFTDEQLTVVQQLIREAEERGYQKCAELQAEIESKAQARGSAMAFRQCAQSCEIEAKHFTKWAEDADKAARAVTRSVR